MQHVDRIDRSKPHRVKEDGRTTVYLGQVDMKVDPRSAPPSRQEKE